jgi:hypothetical protein
MTPDWMRIDLTAHAEHATRHILHDCYEYDPADDGPECEIITRILARHPLYIPGVEKRFIKFSRMLDVAAIAQFSQAFADISEDERAVIRNRVSIALIRKGIV